MKIIYREKLQNKRYLDDVLALLTESDQDFVPPLSSRSSTTQSYFEAGATQGSSVAAYFEKLRKQPIFLALQDGKVVGFLSIIKRYTYPGIAFEKKYADNVYVSTVVVSKAHRGCGIAVQMYRALLTKFSTKYILTRTWSTNEHHIKILRSYRFDKFEVRPNDRGHGIDTVYFCRAPIKKSFWGIINQYHLFGNLIFMLFLFVFTVIAVLTWLTSPNAIVNELGIAFATSLMASFFCLISDTIVKYRDSKNDEYVSSLKGFGIESLHFHKDILLEGLIPKSNHELWISGYRLIMTSRGDFLNAIETACKRNRGYQVRVLLIPYWTESFAKIYGTERVCDNYALVFDLLQRCRKEYGTDAEVRFADKPIFSDTYKVDDRIITGPYLHCKDKGGMNRKLTAKDFFSLDIIDENKELHRLMLEDFLSVWDSAKTKLDWDAYTGVADDIPKAQIPVETGRVLTTV